MTNPNSTDPSLPDTPTIPHAYLTNASGQPIKFFRRLAEACPVCGRGAKPAQLAVLVESPAQQIVHCERCEYHETRRPQATFRPMNSGHGPGHNQVP